MENQKELDERYMRRCLQLAANGRYTAKPNPMVGAVIVCDNRIIGEGYHIRCGEAHAEVNAFASVRPEDESLLKDATIYVSLTLSVSPMMLVSKAAKYSAGQWAFRYAVW